MDRAVWQARDPVRFLRALAAAAMLAALLAQAVAFAVDLTPRPRSLGAGLGAAAPGRALLGAKGAAANPSVNVADLPRGASQNWWRRVQRGLAESEYYPSHNRRGLQAPNRAHNLRTYFGPTGIRLHDRTAVGGPELAGLTLAGIGRGENLEAVPAGTVNYSAARVEIRRPGVIEWYENSARGLEQGFTLPARMKGEGFLVLELAVEHAKASLHGQSIELATVAGRKLRYGKLIATGAQGEVLKSRLEVPSPQRIWIVVEDAGATYPLVIDPLVTGEPNAILDSNADTGSHDAAVFGGSVAGAGDVNGDGFDDVIVGALGWDNGLFDEGAAFVFLGSAGGIVGMDPATAHAVILSNEAAVEFGTSVAGAGDVNGDGFDDIIVGAPFYPGTLFFEGWGDLEVTGSAFVFYGSAEGITATDPTMADRRIDANQIDSILGWRVAGAGDVNGDGFDDIIVGAIRQASPFASFPPNQGQGYGGAALVFHGSSEGIIGTGFADADAVLLPYPAGSREPSVPGTFMGAYVSGAGDVNGDGFDDILVNILGASLFLGSANGIVGRDPTTAHAHLAGPGAVVSGAGDVNGDGFADIILGAPGLDGGAFAVFLGGLDGITATAFSQAQTIVQGDGGVVGIRVAGAGDVDNDGYDDVIVGARGYVGGLDSEGAGYVFRGGAGGIVGSTLLDAYVRLESNQSEAVRRLNRSAVDVAGAGDIDGDGFADVIVGFGFYDAGESDEGAAFIYYGGPAPVSPNQWPVADAGPDQAVVDVDNVGGATITVDGSASVDPDGSIVSYAWLEGETLLGTSPVLTTSLAASGDHRLVLTVTDNDGVTRGDVVTIRVDGVESAQLFFDDFLVGFGAWVTGGDVMLSSVDIVPTPPQVRIGAPGAFLRRSIDLPLGSTGMTLRYWGKASQFSTADELPVKVSVDGDPFTTIQTLISSDSTNSYQLHFITFSWFPLTVSNVLLEFESNMTTGLFSVDDVIVRALLAPPGPVPPPGEMPVANAGVDQTVDDNDSDGFEVVNLDGSLSMDPDGFYQWFEVITEGTLPNEGTFPIGSGATLAAPFGRGSHTVQLIVTDNDGGSASDTVVVTVNQALGNNQPPMAHAGLDKTLVDLNGDTLEFVVFDGRGSTDPDGTIASYDWTKAGNPFGDADRFTVQLPLGVHPVELTVTDNQGATSSPDTVIVTVVASDPAPPIDSFAATATTITTGGFTTLSWTTTGADTVVINAGPNLSLDGSITVSPTTTTLYILTAIGPAGAAQALVTVTVNPLPPEPPTVDSFSATPTSIIAGVFATLSWTTTGADSVTIDNGVEGVVVDAEFTVTPIVTTTYTLTATNLGGATTASVTVNVGPTSQGPPTAVPLSASGGRLLLAAMLVMAGASLLWSGLRDRSGRAA